MLEYVLKALITVILGWLLASELVYCLPKSIYAAALILLLSWLLAGRYLGIGEMINKDNTTK